MSTCNIRYAKATSRANNSSRTLDLFRPAGSTPAPVVVFIHGGGWSSGSSAVFRTQAAYFAQHGLAAVSINYTLSLADQGSWPVVMNDVEAAVSWVRTQGRAYGIDGTRIGTYGGSAGGHLAAMLGTTNANRILATVSLSGPMDLRSNTPMPPNSASRMLGCDPFACPSLATAASPIMQVDANDADFLLFHSASEGIPVSQATTMAAALDAASVSNELVVLPGSLHASAFQCATVTVEGRSQPAIDAFSYLASRLLEGPTPVSSGFC